MARMGIARALLPLTVLVVGCQGTSEGSHRGTESDRPSESSGPTAQSSGEADSGENVNGTSNSPTDAIDNAGNSKGTASNGTGTTECRSDNDCKGNEVCVFEGAGKLLCKKKKDVEGADDRPAGPDGQPAPPIGLLTGSPATGVKR